MEKQVAAAMSCGATMNQQDGEHRGGRGGEQFFICSPSAPMMCFFLPHLPTFISAPPAESFARTTKEQHLLAAHCVISTLGNLAKAVTESLRPPRRRRQLQFLSSNFFVLSFTLLFHVILIDWALSLIRVCFFIWKPELRSGSQSMHQSMHPSTQPSN